MAAVFSAMMDKAKPVFERVESPERGGMSTPEDSREVAALSLDVLRQAVPPELFGVLVEVSHQLAPMVDEMERRKGLLMTESETPPTSPPDVGTREGTSDE